MPGSTCKLIICWINRLNALCADIRTALTDPDLSPDNQRLLKSFDAGITTVAKGLRGAIDAESIPPDAHDSVEAFCVEAEKLGRHLVLGIVNPE